MESQRIIKNVIGLVLVIFALMFYWYPTEQGTGFAVSNLVLMMTTVENLCVMGFGIYLLK